MRLFIAIDFNEEINNSLCDYMNVLKSHSLKGNFTQKENLHLTLVFIGETKNASAVIQVMNSLNMSPFKMQIGGTGSFKRSEGEIYWVGVKRNESLLNLYNQLYIGLLNSGFKLEDREYKPHLTLGREFVLKDDFQGTFSDRSIEVDKISLKKSEQINGKLTYTDVYIKHF